MGADDWRDDVSDISVGAHNRIRRALGETGK